jgi:Arc/MetJ-type ribon-helix-helix transcriptional regulator
MFISPSEKEAIRNSINLLQERIADLEVTIKNLTVAPGKVAKPAKKEKQKRNWSAESRDAVSARMRKYHADRRAAKAVQ